jgi:hypothetical protein
VVDDSGRLRGAGRNKKGAGACGENLEIVFSAPEPGSACDGLTAGAINRFSHLREAASLHSGVRRERRHAASIRCIASQGCGVDARSDADRCADVNGTASASVSRTVLDVGRWSPCCVDLETKAQMLSACGSFTADNASQRRWRDDPSLMQFLRSL